MVMNNIENQKEELRQYLDAVEQQFNPSDPLTLQAVLYLFYSNYTVMQNSDEIFTNKLLKLVEQCNNQPQEAIALEGNACCNRDCGPDYRGPMREDPRIGHVTNPYIQRDPVSTCVPVQVRRMFLNQGPYQPAPGPSEPRRC